MHFFLWTEGHVQQFAGLLCVHHARGVTLCTNAWEDEGGTELKMLRPSRRI